MKPILMMLLMAVPAAAAPQGDKPLAIVIPPEVSGVVYKVDELKQILSAHIGERLRGRGYQVLQSTTLTVDDAGCHAQSCLEGIPARYNVDLVIAPSLDSDEKTHNYRISIKLFANSSGFKSRDRVCAGCSDYNARDMLGDTVVEMLGGTIVDVPAPSPVPMVVTQRDEHRWVYRGVAIGLFAVGALGLAQGFAEVAHNHDPGCDGNSCYHLDTTKGQALFLTLGLVSVAAGGVLAYFGWRPKKMAVTASGMGVRF